MIAEIKEKFTKVEILEMCYNKKCFPVYMLLQKRRHLLKLANGLLLLSMINKISLTPILLLFLNLRREHLLE